MAKVLVVGGAGYVGSSTAAMLLDQGHDVWVLDDLTTGRIDLIRELRLEKRFFQEKIGDRTAVSRILRDGRFDCLMHFAARSLVGESVKIPEVYFENNVTQTRVLLDCAADAGLRSIIFSSTCSIFGDPGTQVISEALPRKPMNPYGETKLQVELMLEEFAREKGLRSIALRYFNASGAETKLRVGEWHEPETHLVPCVLAKAMEGMPIDIFGTDYPTRDGTCVRDYIHVSDLAAAHVSAMERLLAPSGTVGLQGSFSAYNLGSEKGFTVREIIAGCERVTGKKIEVRERERRAGDPPILLADARLAKRDLGFKATQGIEGILESAWRWEQRKVEIEKKQDRAVFLDRDGTLNVDPGYLSDPSQLALLPGVPAALKKLNEAGFRLVVVTNQSGVARGLIPKENLPKIHDRLNELLRMGSGISIDHFEICTDLPDPERDRRKPKPDLLWMAARKLGISLRRSYMVGDRLSDLDAGKNAGCRESILVLTGHGERERANLSTTDRSAVVPDFPAAAELILSREVPFRG